MTHIVKFRGSHTHRYFVDADTREKICLCGALESDKKKGVLKFHNVASEYNGIIYHSALEARYAAELDWLIKGKQIKSWERQVKLDLKVNGMHINNYYIDFIVHHFDGSREFVEVKGMELEPWKTNWKILEAIFGDFKIHPDDRLLVIKQSAFGSRNFVDNSKKKPRKI